MALGSVRHGGLVDQAIAALRGELAAGAWVAGERLPTIPELAVTLGVGRATAREAVQALAREGWLDVRQGAGTFVAAEPGAGRDAELTRWFRRAEVLELYEARRGLETEAARLAATRRDAQDLAAIEAAWAARVRARSQGRLSEWADADLALHRAVFTAAGNAVLARMFDSLADAQWQAFEDLALDPATSEVDTSDDHEALVKAIRAGNPAAAVGATVGYLEHCEHGLRRLMP